MKKSVVTPEYNSGKKLTIPVKTRTPLEALKMLRAGQPVDVAAGYFDKKGELTPDFYMMDKVDKLHHLAYLRQTESELKNNLQLQELEVRQEKINQTIIKNEQSQKVERAGVGENPG